MAAGSKEEDGMMGLIREAMALRVKYRLQKATGVKIDKKTLTLTMLCVNRHNRGGNYPHPGTVLNLLINIFKEGFNEADANHEGVCVQELPAKERPKNYKTELEYNIEKTRFTSLEGCFDEDSEAAYSTLSHSHLLLTLLCWLRKLKVEVPSDPKGRPEGKWAEVLDRKGCLNPTAVAEMDKGYRVLMEGLTFEVLGWKIQTEEPGACSKISQALNKGQAIALKTTEMTALAVLNGTIGRELQSRLADEVAFEAVKEKVRHELDLWVDDPDFIELFDYAISLGATKNTFVSALCEWASKFADPKKRQLRLTAFGEANKVALWAPRLKVMLIKRALRKEPTGTYCPNPESSWGKMADSDTQKIEELLHYFQVTCKEALEACEPDPVRQMAFQANVGIAITEGFITKQSKVKTIEALLKAAKYDHDMLREMMRKKNPELPEDHPGPTPDEKAHWIDFASVEGGKGRKNPKGKGKGSESAKICMPKVIEHLEGACGQEGIGDQKQDTLEEASKPTKVWRSTPWRAWLRSEIAMNLDAEPADMAAALLVLRGLHLSDWTAQQPIDVQTKEDCSGKRVVAVADIEPRVLGLPPCVPKSAKLSKDTQSVSRVPIVVTRLYTNPPIATTYYVTPEWKMPKDKAEEDAETSVWEFSGDETLHPFWAVLRLTQQELAKKIGAGERLEFNMHLESKFFKEVLVGFAEDMRGLCVQVEVPMMVNSKFIRAGEELVLEAAPKRQAEKRQKTWKDDVGMRARAKAKADAAPVPKAAAPSMYEDL